MLEAGVHPKIVQEQLGHSSIRVTVDLYMHLAGRVNQTAAEAMDAVIAPLAAKNQPVIQAADRPQKTTNKAPKVLKTTKSTESQMLKNRMVKPKLAISLTL